MMLMLMAIKIWNANDGIGDGNDTWKGQGSDDDQINPKFPSLFYAMMIFLLLIKGHTPRELLD